MTRILIFLLVGTHCVLGQQSNGALAIGSRIPSFELKDVSGFRKKSLTSGDLLGKPAILDFWTIGCTACMESLRQAGQLQNKFGDRIQFVLIGQDHFRQEGTTAAAKFTYEKYRDKWKLDLVSGYNAALFDVFDVEFVPYCYWIDAGGIIRAITSRAELTSENVEAFLGGRPITLYQNYNITETRRKFEPSRPLLMDGNGGVDSVFLFRSVFAKWDTLTPLYSQPFITSAVDSRGRAFWDGVQPNQVQLNGAPLTEIIEVAYGDTLNHKPAFYFPIDPEALKFHKTSSYGNFWPGVVLEMSDTTGFVYNWKTGEGLYSYSLIVPGSKATAKFLRAAMQRDLETFLPYEISVERRVMPCWFLDADKSAEKKLRSGGGSEYWRYDPADLVLTNIPFYQLIRYIFAYNDSQPPIIDRTGLTGRIDIRLLVTLMDMEEIRKGLKPYGLHLERGMQEMNVIVVRQRKG